MAIIELDALTKTYRIYQKQEGLRASVRGSLNLIKVAKAQALLAGRNYVSPHDVKTVTLDVLRHRVQVTYEAEAEGKTSDDVIGTILAHVEVP